MHAETVSADAAAAGAADRRRGLALVLAGAIAYGLVHALLRILASDVLGEDDTLEQILVQELRLGYDPRQPPLYDWLLWLVQHLTGPRLSSFLLIKYAALTATAAFLYLAAYRILKDRLWAVLCAESLALIYQIAWRYHEGFTHEVLAMVAVTAALWAYLRVLDHGRLGDYLLLGLVAGLGMLTEPDVTVYLACLLTAGALLPEARARTRDPRMLVTLLLALAVVSPFAYWVLSEAGHRAELMRASRQGHWHDAWIGMRDAARGWAMYLSPLILILPLVFPGFLRTALQDLRALVSADTAARHGFPPLERLVLAAAVIATLAALLGGLVLGIGSYPVHVLMPLYVTSVIWLMGVAKRSTGGGERLAVFGRLALTIAAVALIARLANMFVLDPVCKKCRWGIPYAGLASIMTEQGFQPAGTIVAIDDELAGNLRQLFPAARVVTRNRPDFTPQGGLPLAGSVAIVWDGATPMADVERHLAAVVGGNAPLQTAQLVQVPWRHLWRATGYRTSDWRLTVIQR